VNYIPLLLHACAWRRRLKHYSASRMAENGTVMTYSQTTSLLYWWFSIKPHLDNQSQRCQVV